MNYFGTDLNSAGHYFWELEGETFIKKDYNFKIVPFNPENLPMINNKKGHVEFHNAFGYSILAIAGSCADSRWATESIFWVKETISYSEMKEKILSIPIAKQILDKMPFEIKWL